MEICIDFDGTCVTHEFPEIGEDIGAVPVLKKLIDAGHQLILFTMRSDKENNSDNAGYLTASVKWFGDNNIPLYGINVNPTQRRWTKSPKAYGQLYIDDAALGCPLAYNPELSARPFVDWVKVEEILKSNGIIH